MKKNRPTLILDRFPVFGHILRWSYCFLIVAILLPEGSVRDVPLYLISVPIFGLAALVAFFVPSVPRHRAAYVPALAISVVVVLWACLQSLSFVGNPLASPVWKLASDALGVLPGSISIVPADTIATIVPVVLPFAVFLTGTLLFSSDKAAMSLLKFLAIVGGLVAIYGIIQYQFFPQYLMFRKKEFYLQDLTAVLVNRNSIATYLGASLLLNAGLFYDSLLPMTARNGWGGTAFYARRHLVVSGASLVYGVLFTACLIALLLTKSRAGTVATFTALIGLAFFFVLDGYARIERRSRRIATSFGRLRPIAIAFAAAAVVVLGFILLAGRVLLRADLQGFEDGRFCAYPSIVKLLSDNWVVGTGLGSFRYAYARYQDPLCGGPGVLWDRAHSFYLEGWIDLGVIFPLLVIVAVAALFWIFRLGLKERKSMRWASATGIAILVLFLLHSIVDFSIQIPGVAATFAAIMAGATVLSLNRNRSPKP